MDGDIKGFTSIVDRHLAKTQGETRARQKDQELAIRQKNSKRDDRKLALLEKKAAQSDAAKSTLENKALTEEQKASRLREVYGIQ